MRMKKKSMWLTKALSGILALLGLGACASKKAPVDNPDPKIKEVTPQEEIGRIVVLYGGPPTKYVEKLVVPESSAEQEAKEGETPQNK